MLFTIPLRRALVTTSDLPYPEGVAAAEVLKVGSGTRGETKDDAGEAREGLTAVIYGSVASAGLAIFTLDAHRRRRPSPDSSASARTPAAATTSRSRSRCSAPDTSSGCRSAWRCSTGLLIAWAGAVPILTLAAAGGRRRADLAAHTEYIWRHQVRFIGAGTIADRRDLDAPETCEAGRRRPGQHHRVVSRDGDQRRARSRHVARLDRRPDGRLPRRCRRGCAVRFVVGTPLEPTRHDAGDDGGAVRARSAASSSPPSAATWPD